MSCLVLKHLNRISYVRTAGRDNSAFVTPTECFRLSILRLLQKPLNFSSSSSCPSSLASSPPHLRSPYSHSSQVEKEKKMDSEFLCFENLGTPEDLAWAVENANANLSIDEFLADDCLGEVETLDGGGGDKEKETQLQRHDEDDDNEEEEEEEEEEVLFGKNNLDTSCLISVEAPPVSELALPAADREDEWISRYVYDAFSEIPAYEMPITLPPRPPPPAAVPAAEAPVKSKRRSKRRRPSSGSWSSSSLWVGCQFLCVDSSTSSSSSSSTATISTTTTGAFASSVSTCSSSSAPVVAVAQHMYDEIPPSSKRPNKPKKRGRKPKMPPAMEEPERGSGERRCSHCGVNKTPQWRTGPHGAKTLCNACGVRYKSGRLLPEYRPACSPTFVSHVHSNSHRKVLEMRLKKEEKHGGGSNLRLVPSF